jgi:hypothetical protein
MSSKLFLRRELIAPPQKIVESDLIETKRCFAALSMTVVLSAYTMHRVYSSYTGFLVDWSSFADERNTLSMANSLPHHASSSHGAKYSDAFRAKWLALAIFS